MIYAIKNGLRTQFTDVIWKNMGKDKNGWKSVSQSEYNNYSGGALKSTATSNAKDAIEAEKLYKQLTEQAKGFVTDGKLEDALAKYQEAQQVKDSPYLKGVITKLSTDIEKTSQFNELVENGNQAFQEEDYVLAIEMYESALEIKEDVGITAKIEEAEEKLENED